MLEAESKKNKESKSKKMQVVNIISGTHWDREWRYTAEESLLRLAGIVDDLLDVLEQNEDYICFHLDGGTVVIEDYLAVRPENKDRLKKLIERGKIKTVSWYTLPEMSTVAPESLIRNLLIGKRLVDEFGGPMKTGYTATSYGQISQLPQIYSGFGMEASLSYRGTNKHQVPPICNWVGPDGSNIYHIRCFDEATRTNWFFLLHYELVLNKLPRDLRTQWDATDFPVHMIDEDTYQTAFQFLDEKFDFQMDKEKAIKAIKRFVKQASPQAIGNQLLGLDMEDNASPYSNLTGLIDYLNSLQNEYKFQQVSLDSYLKSVKEEISDKEIPTINGEMRYTAIEVGFNGLLGMTHSSRVLLKLMNDKAESELIYVAEPLSAMAKMLGGVYETTLIDRAWLDLLKNHAHDSICGAAIEEAHKDNPTRFRTVTSIAKECSRKSVEYLVGQIDTNSVYEEGDITLTFFNTLTTDRKGVVKAIVDVPNIVVGNFLIEPCSGAGPLLDECDPSNMVTYEYFDIFDEEGNEIDYILLEKEKINMEVERKLDSNAAAYKMIRNRLLLDIDIPAMGYRTYALRPRKRKYVTHPEPGDVRPLIAQPDGKMENEFLNVEINSNGTLDLTDKTTGKTIKGMHYFMEDGSIGNAHLHLQPLRNYTITSLGNQAAILLLENNKLRATWKIDMSMQVPVNIDQQDRNRSDSSVEMRISTFVTLRRGSKYLEFKSVIDNQARDHRVRVMLPSDIETNFVHADSPFDVIKRDIRWQDTGDNMEKHYACQPMKNFVSLNDEKVGLSFFSKGLGEYEVLDDKRRTLAITLLRCHRAYMLAARDHLAPEELDKQQGQHNLGITEFNYAISLHKGDWLTAGVAQMSQEFKTPHRAIQGVTNSGILPVKSTVVAIDNKEQVRLSALYWDQPTESYILRVWNTTNKPAKFKLSSIAKINKVEKVSMDLEETLEDIEFGGGSWKILLRKAEIATFKLTR